MAIDTWHLYFTNEIKENPLIKQRFYLGRECDKFYDLGMLPYHSKQCKSKIGNPKPQTHAIEIYL